MMNFPQFVINDIRVKISIAKIGYWCKVSEKALEISKKANENARKEELKLFNSVVETAMQMF